MIDWSDDLQCSIKSMPEHCVFLLVEGWGTPAANKFDHIELLNNPSLKRTPLEADVHEFLSDHNLMNEYANLVNAMKDEGDALTPARLGDICFGNAGVCQHFEAKGVKLFVCRTTVNAGSAPSKDFVWLELSAHKTYIPAQLFLKRNEEGRSCVLS